VVEYLEEELVVALLENDDDDEREEEIIFAGERTRIITTGIFIPKFYGVPTKKRRSKKSKRIIRTEERIYKTLNVFFLSLSFHSFLSCCVGRLS